jgi:deoxyribonuclease-1
VLGLAVEAYANSHAVLPKSFAQAKRLMALIYRDHRTEFYCGCRFSDSGDVEVASCNYVPARPNRRSRRIEWDHVVPAEAFGRTFAEWRDGHPDCVRKNGKRFAGRRCAEKVSPTFRQLASDPHNLVPAIGELNGLRRNYSMAMIDGEERRFGRCDVEIKDKKIEPRPEVRGDIARVYLYMDATYPGRSLVSSKNRKLFEAWSAEDPPDAWECQRARLIAEKTAITDVALMSRCAAILQADRSPSKQ